MSLTFTIVFGVLAWGSWVKDWPMYVFVISIVLCVLSLIWFLAKHRVFGDAAADSIESLDLFDGSGDGFDFFDGD